MAVLEGGWRGVAALHALVCVNAIGQMSSHRCCSGIGGRQKARYLKHGGYDEIGRWRKRLS
jgi:hypothetical protein